MTDRHAIFGRFVSFAKHWPRLTALFLGVVSASGFQPFALWPLALLAMGAFVLLVSTAPDWRKAAWWGWFFGLGHFTFGNSWIATAFTYQAEMPPVLGWFAVPLLSLYLAVYPALAAGAARALTMVRAAQRPARHWAFLPGFAGCWIISEWLRGWVFTGYPWNPFGIVFLGPLDRPGIAAIAPWLGTYALSGLAVLIAGGLVFALRERRFVSLAMAAILLSAGMYWPVSKGREGTLAVTVVQPDLPQDQLNDPRRYEANFQKLAALSLPRDDRVPRLVLWPESGLPDYLRDGYPQRYYDQMTVLGSPEYARERIARTIGPGSLLLTGAVDLDIENDRAVGARNAVTALNASGAIVGSYYKAHLVPYGEYLALRWLLEPLGGRRLVAGAMDFLPGPGPRTLDLGPWGHAGVQICYEIIFSGHVTQPGARPDYIFNPSNDGWFGMAGPPQHFAQARLRAIEEGLPVLRSTTTGISGIIDARGVVRDHLRQHRAGRMDAFVPPAAPPTLFSRTGNILPLAWAIVFLVGAFVAMRRRGR
ncbi:apolipoprotein N-acyltransferase [Altericroceibacterium spongiae]|uniref:Apolipoprotein N-acyltransferase n=1 Tax=Altericroceibacterium spongiae TaxID=2320269 RepID=A0A420ELL5_9SPHN|nr:apolipoprotein N-acyltransferase [Altericroceibacterium spongiae]RKF21597.1 apolipoprotein N-acyltransferase [Altericroceibacterium spongiae]